MTRETRGRPCPDWRSTVMRCQAVVYRRDTYRRTGRGESGFKMHYAKSQCKRSAFERGLCRQHAKQPDPLRVCPW
jgi:hypothetical protein